MQGKIIASLGGVYTVYCDKLTYNVIPKGIFKFHKKSLYVGDNVEFDTDNMIISSINERKNELIRPRSANIDLLLITMSIEEPEFSLELLYRFLTYANMNNIPAKVILTKIDLNKDSSKLELIKEELSKLEIEVFFISKDDTSQLEKIKTYLEDKVTILMGQTGVGKSSIINLIDSSYERKIGDYSFALGRGKHQTKEVILLPYENGFIGDTPGFSSLELVLTKEDLAKFFPGYNKLYVDCFYSNCLHLNEKQCKIKEEIEKGNLSENAYKIYKDLLETLKYEKERF